MARRWPVLLATIGVVTLAAWSASLLVTPVYVASTDLRIGAVPDPFGDIGMPGAFSAADAAKVEAAAATIHARDLAIAVAGQLNLSDDGEFRAPAAAGGTPGATPFDRLIEVFESRLEVIRHPGERFLTVAFRSDDPQRAADIANAVAAAYVARAGNPAGTGWAPKHLDAAPLAALPDIATESPAAAADREIALLSAELPKVEADAASANADLGAARLLAQGDMTASANALSNGPIVELRRHRNDAAQALALVQDRYGPLHPEYARARETVLQDEASVREEARRILSGVQSKAGAISARAATLRARIAQLDEQQAQAADSAAPGQSTAVPRFANEADRASSRGPLKDDMFATQVSRAATPPGTPVAPDRGTFVLVGMIVGLVLGLGLVALLQAADHTVRSGADLEAAAGVPLLATIPRLARGQLRHDGAAVAPEDLIVTDPQSPYAAAFREMGEAILRSPTRRHAVIAILSAQAGAARATISLSLARTMAIAEHRVILVDCDSRRDSAIAQDDAALGLLDVLSGAVSLEQAIVHDPLTPLRRLPMRAYPYSAEGHYDGLALRKLLDTLRAGYDHVILDVAPLLSVPHASAVAALADVAVLVGRAGRTRRDAVQLAAGRSLRHSTKLAGVILSVAGARAQRRATHAPSADAAADPAHRRRRAH